jgi:(p)ppGpp synthase/HD superfamily hydrolase
MVPFSPRFSEALTFASSLHRDQVRKGPISIPYLGHLLSVAAIVIDFGGTEDEAIAALLHDAVEDQGGPPTLQMIERLFGAQVAEIVDGCSDTDEQPKPAWLVRKEQYIAHLREASSSVLLVAAADKLANGRSLLIDLHEIGDAVWSRFNCTKEQSLWYYREVVRALSGTLVNAALLRELDWTVAEIERLSGDVA